MTSPKTYRIEELLDAGIQPLPDLPEEEITALGRRIGRGPLDDPITLSSDGILLDGHQRLKAMLSQGRKVLDATDVRILADVTRANALDKVIELNVARRHLSTADKAELARKLQRDRRWSQARIARIFHVSRPAVSQWLAAHEPNAIDIEPPPYVEGLDGKAYSSRDREETKAPTNPWSPKGYAFLAVRKAQRALAEPMGGLSALQEAKLLSELQTLAAVLDTTLQRLEADDDDEVLQSVAAAVGKALTPRPDA